MGKRLLYQNSMEETLQQLLQDREQQLMQINRELQHLPGGSLHIRKRNGRIFVCEYSNGRETVSYTQLDVYKRQVVEGMFTTEAAYELARREGVERPITEAIYRAIKGEIKAADAVGMLMTRDKKREQD